MYHVGDIIMPREGETPLVAGHYRVIDVRTGSVHLERLSVVEGQPADARMTRVIFVPRELMQKFDRVDPPNESDPLANEV